MAMYYEESGDKNAPTIVFIHGGGISGWMWKSQVAAFKDYHCIVPDLPEHGRSIHEGPLTIRDSAEEIVGIIKDCTSTGKAHVVGHSIGAKIIVELLDSHPETVDHAVIISALFRPMLMLKLSCSRTMYKMTVNMLKNRKLLAFQTKQFGFTDDDDNQNLMNDFKHLTVDSLDDIYGELFKNLNLPKHLSNAEAPSLVIAGDKEPKAMRESVKDIANALPNGKGILFKGSKHDIPWKAGSDLNITIREWIENKSLTSDVIKPIL